MPSPLFRRLDKAAAAAGLGRPSATTALHVVTTPRDYHATRVLFRSGLRDTYTPPGIPRPVVDPSGTVYERLTYERAVAEGVVFETPDFRARQDMHAPPP